MSGDRFASVDVSGDHPDLAALFCDQLQVLGHPLPSQLVISELGDLLLCIMSWTPSPGFGLPEVASAALGELTEAHLHRLVGEVKASQTPGFNGALVYFFLDGSTEEPGERADAMVHWVRQARRTSRQRHHDSFSRGTEARYLRARSRIARSEARRARRRRAGVGAV
jgi:hypothetical protein